MSLIPCTGECVYQKEGYCSLERAASRGKPERASGNCIHFIKRQK
jgi:hypothetical protein